MSMPYFAVRLAVVLCGLCLGASVLAQDAPKTEPHSKPGEHSALQVFEKRILPIMQAKRPSSCTECHLSGVELKDYIFPDQAQTFASLVKAGMIDTKTPANSKLLKFIARKPEKPSLVSDAVRQEEAGAFKAWIEAAVRDPKLLAAKPGAAAIGPHVSPEVIRHARQDQVLQSFLDNVWSEAGRCAACHSPDKNQDKVKKFGERVSWIKPRDPQATLKHIVDSGLIDTDNPEKSLLLTKPTVQVEHGGGQKAVVGDRTYKQFRAFIDDYAAIVNGKYRDAKSLPQPNPEASVVSEIWFKVEGIPANLDKLLLRADVYVKSGSGWSKERVATGDRLIFGKGGLWQQHLSLTAARGSQRATELQRSQQLPAGRYLVKISIDRDGKLQKDFRNELTDGDVVGQVEVETKWPAGYGAMTVVKFPQR